MSLVDLQYIYGPKSKHPYILIYKRRNTDEWHVLNQLLPDFVNDNDLKAIPQNDSNNKCVCYDYTKVKNAIRTYNKSNKPYKLFAINANQLHTYGLKISLQEISSLEHNIKVSGIYEKDK